MGPARTAAPSVAAMMRLGSLPARHPTLAVARLAPRMRPLARAYATGAEGTPRLSLRQRLWRNRWVRYPVYGVGSMVFSVTTILAVLLAYDVSSYHHAAVGADTVPELAECPTGGPNNLRIMQRNPRLQKAGDEKGKQKERLVIVGGGWAAVALLSRLDRDAFDVTVVSPNNFFLFTPLLPSALVGTVEPRSIVESMRKIISWIGGRFVQGAAVNLVMRTKLDASTQRAADGAEGLVEVEAISDDNWDGDRLQDSGDQTSHNAKFYVPYDKLVIACGSVTNTHGVPGLENCFRLKTIQDARNLRKHLLDNLEIAALPTTSEEERKRLLSFVICGGGPTGVEAAAEIFDMLHEDVGKFFPPQLLLQTSVHILQSQGHVLNTYSEKISEFAERKFRREGLDVVTNARVDRVEPGRVYYKRKEPVSGVTEDFSVPSGCTLWSAGISMAPFSRRLSQTLEHQGHPHALRVDEHLRVLGTPKGTVYALGDASTSDYDMRGFMQAHIGKFDADGDGELTRLEFNKFARLLRGKFPVASNQLLKIDQLFDTYDKDKNHRLSTSELTELVLDATKNMTSLPPTAQVSSQEGKYMGRKLMHYARKKDAGVLPDGKAEDIDDFVYHPFRYLGLGSVAYLGNAAAFDLPLPDPLHTFFGGLLVMYAWRSVYLSELVTMRMRMLVLADYIKRGLWGRDLCRI